ncbi:MAG: Uma2 family endonuclease [Lachnospiraceae bacterium]|nr:Uma2 family endonuclease [Lachnospiraceae bacterium]
MGRKTETDNCEATVENNFDTRICMHGNSASDARQNNGSGATKHNSASETTRQNSRSDTVQPNSDSDAALQNDATEPGVGSGSVTYPDTFEDDWPVFLKEAEVAYGRKKKQGEFTIEDYYALPDDERVELIDGVIYNMSAPVASHQSIVAGLTTAFCNYVESKNGDCEVFPGPIDVQLDRDDRTMVQPDVLILCDRDKLKNGIIYGAPDFVVEVLSPSTSRKDRIIKLRKYREAGVREYWMVDIKRKEVEVYIFQNPELATLPRVYGFEDIIPVGIYGGDCVVDFSRISRRISWME